MMHYSTDASSVYYGTNVKYQPIPVVNRSVRINNKMCTVFRPLMFVIDIGYIIGLLCWYDMFNPYWHMYLTWAALSIIISISFEAMDSGADCVIYCITLIISKFLFVMTVVTIHGLHEGNIEFIKICEMYSQVYNITTDCTLLDNTCYDFLTTVGPKYENKVFECSL